MKEYARGPLSSQYRDMAKPEADALDQSIIDRGFNKNRPIITHDGKIEEGWQRYQACLRTSTEGKFEEWKGTREELEDFVFEENSVKRHLSPAELQERIADERDARRLRVADARRNGESLRTIADNENVSATTVQKDLDEIQVSTGCTPEPSDGKVTGQDGKKQKSKKPPKPRATQPTKVICERCKRLGGMPIAGCINCKTLANHPPGSKPPKPSKNGQPVFDDRKLDTAFGTWTRLVDDRGRAYPDQKKYYEAVVKLVNDSYQALQRWRAKQESKVH